MGRQTQKLRDPGKTNLERSFREAKVLLAGRRIGDCLLLNCQHSILEWFPWGRSRSLLPETQHRDFIAKAKDTWLSQPL